MCYGRVGKVGFECEQVDSVPMIYPPPTVQRPLSSLESPCSPTQCMQASDAGLDCAFIPVHSGFLSGLASSTCFFTSSLAGGFWLASFATGGSWLPSFGDCFAASAECGPIKNTPRLAKIMKHSSRDLSMVSSSCGIQPCLPRKLMSTF